MELSLTENERVWLCGILAYFSAEYPGKVRIKFNNRRERHKHIQEAIDTCHALLDKIVEEDTDEAF